MEAEDKKISAAMQACDEQIAKLAKPRATRAGQTGPAEAKYAADKLALEQQRDQAIVVIRQGATFKQLQARVARRKLLLARLAELQAQAQQELPELAEGASEDEAADDDGDDDDGEEVENVDAPLGPGVIAGGTVQNKQLQKQKQTGQRQQQLGGRAVLASGQKGAARATNKLTRSPFLSPDDSDSELLGEMWEEDAETEALRRAAGRRSNKDRLQQLLAAGAPTQPPPQLAALPQVDSVAALMSGLAQEKATAQLLQDIPFLQQIATATGARAPTKKPSVFDDHLQDQIDDLRQQQQLGLQLVAQAQDASSRGLLQEHVAVVSVKLTQLQDFQQLVPWMRKAAKGHDVFMSTMQKGSAAEKAFLKAAAKQLQHQAQAERARDRKGSGSGSGAWAAPSDDSEEEALPPPPKRQRMEPAPAFKQQPLIETRSCACCDKMGHVWRNCPDLLRMPEAERTAKIKQLNELYSGGGARPRGRA
eukprot:XP_001700681.1 predicted protein [Chlamydomonas reinhardtii]